MCDRFPRKFDVQTSYNPWNYVLGLLFVVNIKFPRVTYHTIVPSTDELYCLISITYQILKYFNVTVALKDIKDSVNKETYCNSD